MLWEGECLIGVILGYLKINFYGEFVFDYVWVNVYVCYGCDYYLKWLGVVLYLLVIGLCLLVCYDLECIMLLLVLCDVLLVLEVLLVYINFYIVVDEVLFGDDWLLCEDVQFQWQNLGDWVIFDQFFGVMNYKYCKNICQEWVKVVCQSISFCVVYGDDVSCVDLQVMYCFYLQIFFEYGNVLVLIEVFLCYLVILLGCGLVLFLVEQDGELIVGVLCLCGGDMLYGCYWGGVILFGLYFEVCYY